MDGKIDFANLDYTRMEELKMKENGTQLSMNAIKSLMYNSYILKRFFELSGFRPNRYLNAKIMRELINIASKAA
ncbi:hypothetical protein D0T84_05485 [Dysgonomonas sp. 521]|nr:hypothetical protein [Dysgonomonas sp. 521]